MDATTPPTATGFNRKPNPRNKKFNRKPNKRRSGINPTVSVPSDATAWLYGSMFLMAAAKILAPFIGLTTLGSQSTTINNE